VSEARAEPPVSKPVGPSLKVSREGARELYRLMALTRALDQEATALQRQGELAVYPQLVGQEAAQVGSAAALGADDWIFPSYRELGAALVRGIDMVEYLAFYRATWHGGMWDPMRHRFAMVSVPVASQLLHAVGYAMGAQLDGRPECALAYFGDGATSQGDFHEACNFAGVFRAPVIFFCQNNQWAISVPLAKQTAAPIHRKAEAYGFPGVRVDGNDVAAVYAAVHEAAERARGGEGPTLIEAVTYRMAAHSTADDASRYQPEAEVQTWRGADPLERWLGVLRPDGAADQSFLDEVEREARALAARTREGVLSLEPRPTRELFSWVFADLPPDLVRQLEQVERDG
jgi:2-oxoisovalerate dehydrogenase E1 component alpha subunit